MNLTLQVMADRYAIHRLAPDAELPGTLGTEPFYAVLRSPAELSVCCRAELEISSQRREDGWRCMAVAGPLDFGLTGILAGISVPLAEAGIPVFVISSFDTDYVLVPEGLLPAARAALSAAGMRVREEQDA